MNYDQTQDGMSFTNKLTMILEATEFEEYMNGIGIYVNALNLLLNALQWSVFRNSDAGNFNA